MLTSQVVGFKDVKGIVRKKMDTIKLPGNRINHCLIELCDNEGLFLYGGYSEDGCFLRAYNKNPEECKKQRLLGWSSSTAYILKDNSSQRIPEPSPCEYFDHATYSATCAARRTENGQCEVVIPGFDSVYKTRCTSILNTKTLTWRKLPNDDIRTSLFGGIALSVRNNTRIMLFGGVNGDNEILKTIYEFKNDSWVHYKEAELPVPVSNAPAPLSYFPMHTEHCNSDHTV